MAVGLRVWRRKQSTGLPNGFLYAKSLNSLPITQKEK
jgi:hypothetical protein